MNNPDENLDLRMKIGKASDLEDTFEEVLSELTLQIMALMYNGGTGTPTKADLAEFKPEIEKAKKLLLDKVSNTMIFDPH